MERAQPEAIQEVASPDDATKSEVGNFLDRRGPSGLAMTIEDVRASR
jgi:hypothetical protein